MANQIVKQPDGNFAIWSSNLDDFTVTDATRKEIMQEFIDDAIERVRHDVDRIFEKIVKGEKPYFQFTMTFEECQKRIAEREQEETEIEENAD